MLLLILNAIQLEEVQEAGTKACLICVKYEKVPEEVEQVTEELKGMAQIEPNDIEEFEELEKKNKHIYQLWLKLKFSQLLEFYVRGFLILLDNIDIILQHDISAIKILEVNLKLK